MLSVPINGSARLAALPRAGQIAPNNQALVSRLAWPGSPSGPLLDSAVLLPNPGLVLPPDLDRPAVCALRTRAKIF